MDMDDSILQYPNMAFALLQSALEGGWESCSAHTVPKFVPEGSMEDTFVGKPSSI